MTSKRRMKTGTVARIRHIKYTAEGIEAVLDADVKLSPNTHINKGLLEEVVRHINWLKEDQLKEDIEYLLSLIPDWAKIVPKGLDPTFYGTGSYEGDLKVQKTINRIKARHLNGA